MFNVSKYSFAVCNSKSIRLVNGSNIYEGRVEVCLNNQWGTVCDNHWNSLDAKAVCNQLGYPSSDAVALSNSYFGSGYGPIWFSQVKCSSSETNLFNCNKNYTHNCTHFEDAGVQCINESSISLCNISKSIRLVNGSNIYEGRLEVCLNNQWGTVCDDDWDSSDAQVVCNQLEYPSSGAVALSNSYFGGGYGPIWLSQVMCSGSERYLFSCNYNHDNDCTHFEDAGVQCIIESSTPVITTKPTPTGNIELINTAIDV